MLFIFGISFHANAEGVCETGLSTPALRYLRTLRAAIATGDVTPENLAWTLKQPKPAEPLRDARTLENLAFQQSFRRAIPGISLRQWELLKVQLRQIADKQQKSHAQIREAQIQTAFIQAILPMADFAGVPSEVFVSSKGEVFIAEIDGEAYIHNLTKKSKFKIDNRAIALGSNDFFEDTNGDVYFTQVGSKHITVHNVITESEVAKISIFEAQEKDKPILYQENGRLMVIVAANTGSKHGLDPLLKYDVQRGHLVDFDEKQEGRFRVLRLSNGHLYIFGKKHGLRGSRLLVRDLTLGSDVVTVPAKESEIADLEIRLIDGRTPTLVATRPPDYKPWYTIDASTHQFHPIAFTEFHRTMPTYLPQSDTNVAAEIQNWNYKPRLVLQEILLGAREFMDIEFNGSGIIKHQFTFSTQDGPMLAFIEGNGLGPGKIHLFSLIGRRHIEMPCPDFQSVTGLFQSPEDGRILLLAKETFHEPWRLYQVYGPERK